MQNYWNFDLKCKRRQPNEPVNYRDFRETGLWLLIVGKRGENRLWRKKKNCARLASLADILPIQPRYFAIFPQCGAWSQATCNLKSFFTIRSQRHLLLTPEHK